MPLPPPPHPVKRLHSATERGLAEQPSKSKKGAKGVEARVKDQKLRSPFLKGALLETLRIVSTASPSTSKDASSVSPKAGAPVACTAAGEIQNIYMACSEMANWSYG